MGCSRYITCFNLLTWEVEAATSFLDSGLLLTLDDLIGNYASVL